MTMNTMKDKLRIAKIVLVDIAVILSLVMAFDPVVRDFVFFNPSADAVGAFDAVAMVGQMDENGNEDYTSSTVNRSSGPETVPNIRGVNAPQSAVVDTTNNRLFVADSGNNRIIVFELDGSNSLVDHQADYVIGQVNFATNTSGTSRSAMNYPRGLAYDATDERLFVADQNNNRVMVFDASPANLASEAAGLGVGTNAINALGQPDYTSFAAGLSSSSLNAPSGLLYDSADQRLFVNDSGNNRVMVFDVDPSVLIPDAVPTDPLGPSTHVDIELAGSWSDVIPGEGGAYLERPPAPSGGGSGGLKSNPVGHFKFQGGACTSSSNPIGTKLTNTDIGGAYGSGLSGVYACVLSTTTLKLYQLDISEWWTGDQDALGVGIPYDPNTVYDRAEYTPGAVSEAINVIGAPDMTTSSGGFPSVSTFDNPTGGLAYDTTEKTLFVPDQYNSRVLGFDVDTTVLIPDDGTTNGPNALYVIGQIDFTTATSDTTQRTLYYPSGVEFDQTGDRLFVSDLVNSRVMVFDASPANLASEAAGLGVATDAINVIGHTDFDTMGGATTQSRLDYPRGLTYAAADDMLFVTDQNNNRVMVFDVTSPMTNGAPAIDVAGQVDDFGSVDYSSNLADNQEHGITTTTTSAVGLNGPHGITHDENGGSNLFVVDTDNNRVVVHTGGLPTSDGQADIVLGQADMVSSASATTDAGMREPHGAVYDELNGWLFVADTGNNRVLVFDGLSLGDGVGAINVLGQATMTASASAPIASTSMSGPTAVYVNDAGTRLYVSDTGNNRVLVFDIASIADGEAAVGVLGQSLFTTATSAASQGGLDGPTGITHDGTNLYVADTGNNRVMVFDVSAVVNGENATHVLGQDNFTSSGSATSQDGMSAPSGVAYLPDSVQLAVADTGNNRVTFYDVAAIADGDDAVQIIGQDAYGDGAAGTTQADLTLSGVSGLSYFDDENILFVTDGGNHRVMEFGLIRITTSSLTAAQVGIAYSTSVTQQYGGQENPVAFVASGSLPPGLSLSSGGAITGTPTIEGTYPFTVVVTDTIGAGTFTDSADYSIAVSQPYQATNLIGQLYDDTDLPRWNASKSWGFPNGLSVVYDNTGFALDNVNHRFFLIDGPRILIYNLDANDQFTDYIADNVLGADSVYNEYRSFPAASATRFGSVEDIAYDGVNNRLFVVEDDYDRVLVFDTTTITDGEAAVYVFGQTDFTSTTGGTTARKLDFPQEAVYDGVNNRLYVSEGFNDRVVVFDASPANLASDGYGSDAIAVLGQLNFTSNTPATSQGRMSAPYGLTLNAAGTTLYVADSGNQRVLRFDVSTITNGELATAVLGQLIYTTATTGFTAAKFSGPEGVALDEADGLLFVSDRAHCRTLAFNVGDGITNGEAAVNVLGGTTDFTTVTCATNNAGKRQDYFYPNKVFDVYDVEYDAGNEWLYVTDRNSQRVVVYDIGDGITNGEAYISTVGSVNTGKTPELYGSLYANGRGLNQPGGAAIDSVGHQLFIVDKGDDSDYRTKRVLRYELDGNNELVDAVADSVLGRKRLVDHGLSVPGDLSPTASTTKVSVDSGLAIDEVNSRLFVADTGNNRVLVFDIASVSSGMLADYVLGQTTFTGATSALTQRGMDEPMGLAFDPTAQWLFVADNDNKRVMVYDVSPANLASDGNGSDAIAVLGQANFTSSSGGPTINRLGTGTAGTGPTQLAYDEDRHLLYVGDTNNYRVMVFDVTTITNGEDAVNVLGQTNFTTATYSLVASKFTEVAGLAFDPDNELLWVLDGLYNRATVFDVASITNGESAIGVIGQTSFTTSQDFIASQTRFKGGSGLALDAANNRLYLVSDSHHRVMVYEFLENTTTTPASGSVDDLYSAPLTATGYQGTLSFTIASGSLPPGLAVDGTDIAGTPTTEGTYDFTLRAIDSHGVSTFVDDLDFSITIGPAGSTPGGGGSQPPAEVGFFPDRIVINDDAAEVQGYNVLVTVYAHFSEDFTGTIDVLLSNSPSFQTTIPFRYVVTADDRQDWEKTMAWDLCFGLPGDRPCEVGRKTVYARFYVNQELVRPAITPLITPRNER